MFTRNIIAASVAEYKSSDKHLKASVIEFGKEDFPRSIETEANNESSLLESIYRDFDDQAGNHNYSTGSKKNSSGFYSKDRYENYEYCPEWDTYHEVDPNQKLPEIDPAELWAFWHEKEEVQ
jgi:hypothetical protein